MGMTMTQKILAAHAGLEAVSAGQLISAKLDIHSTAGLTLFAVIHHIVNLDDVSI